VYRPERQPPHPLIGPVVAGQTTVYVTVPLRARAAAVRRWRSRWKSSARTQRPRSTAVVVSCW